MKNPKWLPNTSHNIYVIMNLCGGWELCQLICLYELWQKETWKCHSGPLYVRHRWGLDMPLDLLMCTLTSILHVKLGKYELSDLKSFILILGVLRGCYIWHDSTMLTDCLLLKLFGNEENSHLFLQNPKWLPNISHNIYPIMHLWGVDLPVDMLIWNLKLSFLATRYQTMG